MAYFLEHQKTNSTPYVLIDEGKGVMRFEGQSFHENIVAFFSEITSWLKSYLKTDFSSFTFDCELEYFNSSTTKLLFNILLEMDEHASDNKKLIVNWITTEDNEIIIECFEDFQDEMKNLEFNLIIK